MRVWRYLLARASAMLTALRDADCTSTACSEGVSVALPVNPDGLNSEGTPEWLKACVNPDAIR